MLALTTCLTSDAAIKGIVAVLPETVVGTSNAVAVILGLLANPVADARPLGIAAVVMSAV